MTDDGFHGPNSSFSARPSSHGTMVSVSAKPALIIIGLCARRPKRTRTACSEM